MNHEDMPRQASVWDDGELESLMALLDKDYTKLQEPKKSKEAKQAQDGDMADIMAILEREYANLQKPEKPRQEQAPSPEPEAKGDTLREEYIPTEPHRAGTGEQPDFDETPVVLKKEWAVIPLSILAALELAGIVAVIVWWQQWII